MELDIYKWRQMETLGEVKATNNQPPLPRELYLSFLLVEKENHIAETVRETYAGKSISFGE